MIINLFGGPGSGKSTGAAYIFSKLKMAGVSAELVTEFAKDKVWEESKAVFEDQLYILGKQNFKISRCYKKVDVVVTDSPIYLSKIYNSYDGELKDHFNSLVFSVFSSYENFNYFVERVKPYNPIGRFQDEAGSHEISKQIMKSIYDDDIPFTIISGNEKGYDCVVTSILDYLKVFGGNND